MRGIKILILQLALCGYYCCNGQQFLPHNSFDRHDSIGFNIKSAVVNPAILPKGYYVQHLGFFCKEEIRLEEKHIPVKLRLGSLDYCNWMEQKPGYLYKKD